MDKNRVAPFRSLLCVFAATGALVGCAMEDSPYKKTEYQTLSNPASVYCAQQDGKLETVSENAQRVTYCLLPDGSRVEQWEYYRNNHQQNDSYSK